MFSALLCLGILSFVIFSFVKREELVREQKVGWTKKVERIWKELNQGEKLWSEYIKKLKLKIKISIMFMQLNLI